MLRDRFALPLRHVSSTDQQPLKHLDNDLSWELQDLGQSSSKSRHSPRVPAIFKSHQYNRVGSQNELPPQARYLESTNPSSAGQYASTYPSSKIGAWKPVWLRAWYLSTLTVGFLCLSAGLLILWRLDVAMEGIPLSLTSQEYSWKYGPTAIFVVFMGLWSQVDKYTRLIAPWIALRTEGYTEAAMGLEYLSPMPHTIIWTAVKNRHISVVLTMIGSLLLKIITVASTALLVLTPDHNVHSNITFTVSGDLDLNMFLKAGPTLDLIDPAGLMYYGVATQGLVAPNGTQDPLAYQYPVDFVFAHEDAELVAPMSVFIPQYQCTSFGTSEASGEMKDGISVGPLSEAGSFQLQLDYASCPSAFEADPSNSSLRYTTLNVWTMPSTYEVPASRMNFTHFDYYRFPCLEYLGIGTSPQIGNPLDGSSHVGGSPVLGSTDIFIVSNLVLDGPETVGSNQSAPVNKTASIDSVSVVTCRAGFQAGVMDLRMKLTEDGVIRPVLDVRAPLNVSQSANVPGFNDTRFQADMPVFIFITADILPVDLWSDYRMEDLDSLKPYYPGQGDYFLRKRQLIARTWASLFYLFGLSAGASNQFDTLNPEILKTGVQNTFNGVLQQWAINGVFNNATSTKEGREEFFENRLQIKSLSLWVMFVVCIVMATFTIALMFLTKHYSLERSPASMMDFVNILATNHQLRRRFIEVDSAHTSKFLQTDITWYRPITSRKFWASLICIVPLIIIVVLEVIQRQSDRSHGFVEVSSSTRSFSFEAWTHYFPTVVMVLLAISYGCLDFNALLFSPFSKLKTGCKSEESIETDLLMQLKVHNLWTAISTRQFAAWISTVAVLTASVLTVVVAGLYSIEAAEVLSEVSYKAAMNVNLTSGTSKAAGRAAAALSLIDNNNLSYSSWTHEDLILNSVEPSASTSDNSIKSQRLSNTTSSLLEIELPGYRPSLDCTALDANSINASMEKAFVSEFNYTRVWFNIPMVLSNDCREALFPGSNGTETLWTWYYNTVNMTDHDVKEFGFWDEIRAQTGKLECPTMAFAVVLLEHDKLVEINTTLSYDRDSYEWGGDATFVPRNSYIMQCTPKVSELTLKTQLRLPDYTINPSNPPQSVDEKLLPYAPNTANEDKNPLYIEPSTFYQSYQGPSYDDSSVEHVNTFIRAGMDNLNIKNFSTFMSNTPENVDRLTSIVSKMYGRYMVQILDLTRTPATDTEQSYEGTTTSFDAYRIVQHRGPKIALQVMLSVMFVCSSLAYYLVDMRSTLIYEPCSILGRGSLIHNSRLLEILIAQDNPRGGQGSAGIPVPDILRGANLQLGWWKGRKLASEFDEFSTLESEARDPTLSTRWGVDIVEHGSEHGSPTKGLRVRLARPDST